MKLKKINKSLGELEAEIMEVVWELGRASVRDVLDKIKRKRKIAYTTIMTVMARLCHKGILKRKLKDEVYIYRPSRDKQSFLAATSKNIINHLIKEFGEEVAVAQFIDIIESRDAKKSKEWRARLKKIIK